MTDDLNELRARIRIVDLVGQSVSLKRAGKNWTGLCPFHDDKNPSFTVSDDIGRYRCWACGEKGDIFTWVMKTQHLDFPEAVKFLAQSIGYQLKGKSKQDTGARERYQKAMRVALEFFRNEFQRSELAKSYCENRGLPPEILDSWEIGFAPEVDGALGTVLKKEGITLAEAKEIFLVEQDPSGGYFDKFRGRLMFPIRDERGTLVAFGGRILGEGHPKYINSSDTPLFRKSRTLYGLHIAKDHLKDKPIVLCEGYLDVIACHRAGIHTAVASLGTSLTEDHAKLISRWTSNVTILYDADEAGQKAASRASEILSKEGLNVKIAMMPPGEDPDTLLAKGGAAALEQVVESVLSPTAYAVEQLIHKMGAKSEGFWKQVMDILATSNNELEISGIMQRLSGLHPNRDPAEAFKDMKRMLQQRRRPSRKVPREAAAQVSMPKLGMLSGEVVLFRAALSEEFRKEVWECFKTPDMFPSTRAYELAQELAETFPEPPSGAPAQWVDRLPTTASQELLADIDMREGAPLGSTFIKDTIKRLKLNQKKRELQSVKEKRDLEELNRRLRNLDSEKTAFNKGNN